MEHYVNTVQDQQGSAIPGTQISVYVSGASNLADLFSDNGVTRKPNPFTNRANGSYDFYAENGVYDIRFQRSGSDFSTMNETHTRIAMFDVNDSSIGGGGAWTVDVTTANSLGNARCIGDGVNQLCFYTESTLGGLVRPKPDTHTKAYIWNTFTWCVFSIQLNTCMLTVDPNATGNDKYVWTSGTRPIKTVMLPADALYPRGASTLVTDAALISGGLISPYITTTDSDNDGAHRYLVMPANWDGGTVTATITVVNTNATPANAYAVGVSGECYPAGTALGTTISATGSQTATLSFGASGSCGGSACNQNDPASATTAAITVNGTPAGGRFCGFQARTSALGTTETVAGIKIVQLDINYSIAKGF
jgi:hypothetical protein